MQIWIPTQLFKKYDLFWYLIQLFCILSSHIMPYVSIWYFYHANEANSTSWPAITQGTLISSIMTTILIIGNQIVLTSWTSRLSFNIIQDQAITVNVCKDSRQIGFIVAVTGYIGIRQPSSTMFCNLSFYHFVAFQTRFITFSQIIYRIRVVSLLVSVSIRECVNCDVILFDFRMHTTCHQYYRYYIMS